jgi:hypothetical protein
MNDGYYLVPLRGAGVVRDAVSLRCSSCLRRRMRSSMDSTGASAPVDRYDMLLPPIPVFPRGVVEDAILLPLLFAVTLDGRVRPVLLFNDDDDDDDGIVVVD